MPQAARLFRAPSSHCCAEIPRVDGVPTRAQPALTPTCTALSTAVPEEGEGSRHRVSIGARDPTRLRAHHLLQPALTREPWSGRFTARVFCPLLLLL